MYKKITLVTLLTISSLSVASNLPPQTLAKLKELTAQEKHVAEKEKAKNDLKTGAITCAAAVSIFFSLGVVIGSLGVGDWISKNFGPDARYVIGTSAVLADSGLALYGIDRCADGALHLVLPDNPNPEKQIKKNVKKD